MPRAESAVKPIEVPEEEVEVRRLNVNLTAEAYAEINALCARTGRSKSDLVRLALGLLRFAVLEKGKGSRFAIVASDGRVVKELVLPL